jgi:hypothetical protein
MFQLLVDPNVVPGLLILFTLMMEVIFSYEMSVLKRATWRRIPEDNILQTLSCFQHMLILIPGNDSIN